MSGPSATYDLLIGLINDTWPGEDDVHCNVVGNFTGDSDALTDLVAAMNTRLPERDDEQQAGYDTAVMFDHLVDTLTDAELDAIADYDIDAAALLAGRVNQLNLEFS